MTFLALLTFAFFFQQLPDEKVATEIVAPKVDAQVGSMVQKASEEAGRSLTGSEIFLSVLVLIFTVGILLILVWLRKTDAISGDATFKLIGLTIVVGSSLYLITAGWSQQQITPVIGLLGTGLGFVFGKNASTAEEQSERVNARTALVMARNNRGANNE